MKIKWERRYPKSSLPKKWQGIPLLKMKDYRKYVNRIKPGKCGTYASAALVHFTIKEDRAYELPIDKLLTALEPIIEDRLPYKGTFPWDLKNGLNELLEDQNYYAKYHLISNPIVIEQLNKPNPSPVIVGTNRFLASPYGNHWVLVYAYGYNEKGQLFYRAYDNHGSVRAVIPASQTLAAVWLEQES